MRLEEIAAGSMLAGLDPDGAADVIAMRWIGANALDVAYRVNGTTRPDYRPGRMKFSQNLTTASNS
jgi:hypothetical protein